MKAWEDFFFFFFFFYFLKLPIIEDHFFAQIYASLPCTQSGTSSLINFKLETWKFKDIKMTLFPKRDKSIFFFQNVINPTCSSSNPDWPIREQHCGLFWVTLCVTLCTCMYSCKLCTQIMHTFWSYLLFDISQPQWPEFSTVDYFKSMVYSNLWTKIRAK